MAIARREGHEVVECDFDVFHLYTTDEVFVTGSGTDCVPVIEVDGRKIGDGKPGLLVTRLSQLLVEEMDKEEEKSKGK